MKRFFLLGWLLFLVPSWLAPAAAASEPAPAVEREISHLLDFIGQSGCSFSRNGATHDAQRARQHIERKYRHLKSDIASAEDFIRLTASRSSLSGQRYKVRCGENEMDSSDWLSRELQRFRTTP